MQKRNDDVFQNTTHKIESVNIGNPAGMVHGANVVTGLLCGRTNFTSNFETILDFSNG